MLTNGPKLSCNVITTFIITYEFVIICRGVVTLSISTGYFVDDICVSRWYVLIVHLECDAVVVRGWMVGSHSILSQQVC